MLAKLVLGAATAGAIWVAFRAPAPDPLILSRPPADAVDRLRAERRVVEGTGMGSLTLAYAGRDRDALLIGITRAGSRAEVRCRVTLSGETPSTTRAGLDCAQPGGAPPIRQVAILALEMVVREHVAATVDARDYDIAGVSRRLNGLLFANHAIVAASLGRRD